ncbi:hypothetical protein Ocin01_17843 [Orchesella cincta]|uniref:Uncharacterized protein n=1 Tax=Orchesella cincta TaxID=48709 RepID=A0A1D2M792_ORCCI|nr:hypothetical protein Ocin01_17843 [Orchesella cincta]
MLQVFRSGEASLDTAPPFPNHLSSESSSIILVTKPESYFELECLSKQGMSSLHSGTATTYTLTDVFYRPRYLQEDEFDFYDESLKRRFICCNDETIFAKLAQNCANAYHLGFGMWPKPPRALLLTSCLVYPVLIKQFNCVYFRAASIEDCYFPKKIWNCYV